MKFATYDFDDLLAIRAADFELICPSDNDTNEIQKRQIDEYAMLLDRYASDVLSGDFAVFPRLAQVIETRIEKQRREELSSERSPTAEGNVRRWWKWW